jgi:SAM-dependent methyltransferase
VSSVLVRLAHAPDKVSRVARDHFDGWIAQGYDLDTEMSRPEVVEPTVSFLAELAGEGPALELGIGTGRIGLPLHQRGVHVHGIDLSPAMVAQLRAKPGAKDIEVSIGDFASTTVDGTFTLAYLVYNTITNLTTQDEQVACFCNVAAHLESGGYFVIEVSVPELQRLPPGERYRPFTVRPTHLGFDEIDVATQRGVSHHYWTSDGPGAVWSVPFRYVWPSELDLMARIAGMRLHGRWEDWKGEPFTRHSRRHVSVWQKTA